MSFKWIIDVNSVIIPASTFLDDMSTMLDNIYTRITTVWSLPTTLLLTRNVLINTLDSIKTVLTDFGNTGVLTVNPDVFSKYVKRTNVSVSGSIVPVYDETLIFPEDFYVDISVVVKNVGGSIVLTVTYEEYDAHAVLTYTHDYDFVIFPTPVGVIDCDSLLIDVAILRRKVDAVFI